MGGLTPPAAEAVADENGIEHSDIKTQSRPHVSAIAGLEDIPLAPPELHRKPLASVVDYWGRQQSPNRAQEVIDLREWIAQADEDYAEYRQRTNLPAPYAGHGAYWVREAIREARQTNPHFQTAPHVTNLMTSILDRWASKDAWGSPKPSGKRRNVPDDAHPLPLAPKEGNEDVPIDAMVARLNTLPATARAIEPALRNVCGLGRLHTIPDKNNSELFDACVILAEQEQATVADVEWYGQWFSRHDWRGKKGEKPTPILVRQQWAQAMDVRKQPPRAAPSAPPARPSAGRASGYRGPMSVHEGVRAADAHISFARPPTPRPNKGAAPVSEQGANA